MQSFEAFVERVLKSGGMYPADEGKTVESLTNRTLTVDAFAEHVARCADTGEILAPDLRMPACKSLFTILMRVAEEGEDPPFEWNNTRETARIILRTLRKALDVQPKDRAQIYKESYQSIKRRYLPHAQGLL